MRTAVVLFTRDLRVHDQPALAAAVREAEHVIPLFVFDDAVIGSAFAAPNRVRFLLDALADLRESLGGSLVVRRGDVVREALRFDPDAVYLSADVSAYARERERRLVARVAVRTFPGVTVVPPDELAPAGGDHFKVFTPYWRAWERTAWRAPERAPAQVSVPAGIERGSLPALDELVRGQTSPELPEGGETAGARRVAGWLRSGLECYGDVHDALADDATSRLSPYLHFGCVSPLALALEARDRPGGGAFVRQLCWRDFFHQLLLANPDAPREDLRPRGDRWPHDPDALEAWREGRTGYPIVDAGMRQLRREGWMHNRARLLTGSFLSKHLYLDWREGARHFFDLLVDGDVASNVGNWQWVAGTGADTRPNRVFNPVAQAKRHDPGGAYVRRYVTELTELDVDVVHEPWNLGESRLRDLGYPPPIVEHAEAVARFRAARSGRGEQLRLE